MDIDAIRREYLKSGLRRKNLDDNPMRQFEHWLNQAIKAGIPDPTAMVVATVSKGGEPSQRIVLLKQADEKGFVFFTNYASRKAQDIQTNARVSLHFPWHVFERQVKINGIASKVPLHESVQYFLTRPRDSQLAAWASAQSAAINSRQILENQFDAIKEKFKAGKVPLPDFWGGFRVVPYRYEFWQGGAKRLHDRFEYVRENDDWAIARLAP